MLTPEDAAALLCVSPSTVKRLLRSGELGGRRVGRTLWRTTSRDLERFMAARERPAARQPVRRARAPLARHAGDETTDWIAKRLGITNGTEDSL
jgi:excisionase family DNA binding protein